MPPLEADNDRNLMSKFTKAAAHLHEIDDPMELRAQIIAYVDEGVIRLITLGGTHSVAAYKRIFKKGSCPSLTKALQLVCSLYIGLSPDQCYTLGDLDNDTNSALEVNLWDRIKQIKNLADHPHLTVNEEGKAISILKDGSYTLEGKNYLLSKVLYGTEILTTERLAELRNQNGAFFRACLYPAECEEELAFLMGRSVMPKKLFEGLYWYLDHTRIKHLLARYIRDYKSDPKKVSKAKSAFLRDYEQLKAKHVCLPTVSHLYCKITSRKKLSDRFLQLFEEKYEWTTIAKDFDKKHRMCNEKTHVRGVPEVKKKVKLVLKQLQQKRTGESVESSETIKVKFQPIDPAAEAL